MPYSTAAVAMRSTMVVKILPSMPNLPPVRKSLELFAVVRNMDGVWLVPLTLIP